MSIRDSLQPGTEILPFSNCKTLILVEYNVDRGSNPWVPYPLSSPIWETLVNQHGFHATYLLATVLGRWLREIYAALPLKSV